MDYSDISNRIPLNDMQLLEQIVRSSEWFMSALTHVRTLQLSSWCIGAGAIRNLVWDHLHGYGDPSALPDLDVAYFEPNDLRGETDAQLKQQLDLRSPAVPWEVTNQAAVHLWFQDYFGYPVLPLRSLEEAVASWPEYATCVGIHLSHNDKINIVAPHGLADLFELRVRHNPVRASLQTYRERTEKSSAESAGLKSRYCYALKNPNSS